MSMTKRGMTKRMTEHGITQWTGDKDDKAVVCVSCSKIIPSLEKVKDNMCPFCNKDVNIAP